MRDVEVLLSAARELGFIAEVPPPLSPAEIVQQRQRLSVVEQAFAALEGSPEVVAARMMTRWKQAFEIPPFGRFEPTPAGLEIGIDTLLLHPLVRGERYLVIPEELACYLDASRVVQSGRLRIGDVHLSVVQVAIETKDNEQDLSL